MFGQISNHENKFFISGQEIIGIENLDISYSNAPNVSKLLGFSNAHTFTNGPTQQKVSMSRNLIYTDQLLTYTGSNNISGSLNYNGTSYGFKSGYLDDYAINCAIGSVPKISTNITIYDEMLSGVNNASGSVSIPTLYIPNQGSISLTCDNSTTNRVVGFDYSIKASRKPVYTIGSKLPIEVVTLGNLDYSASVQIDVDDAFLSSGLSFLSGAQTKTVSFTIRGRTGNLLQTVTIPKASLVSEALSSSADGGIKLTLNYIGHS
jgi:hypothetical protein